MTTGTESSERLVLRPPRNELDPRARLWWLLQSLITAVPILAGSIAAYVYWGEGRPWLGLAIFGAVVYLVAFVVVEPLWRIRVHRWEVTDDAVYALTGWVVREWRVAPMSRIQTVDAVRGPIEQLLGLSTLRVTTASSKGAIDIGGLDKQTAEQVADRLTVIAQLTPGDAT